MARKNTNKLYNYLDEGLLNHEMIIDDCLKYMSEDEVTDMMEMNEFNLDDDENDED